MELQGPLVILLGFLVMSLDPLVNRHLLLGQLERLFLVFQYLLIPLSLLAYSDPKAM